MSGFSVFEILIRSTGCVQINFLLDCAKWLYSLKEELNYDCGLLIVLKKSPNSISKVQFTRKNGIQFNFCVLFTAESMFDLQTM